ncbi:metal-sulfur cluster assembly factor, partial [Bavariicoccus seileri]
MTQDKESSLNPSQTNEEKQDDVQLEELKSRLLAALESVIDPELGVDIVNLGLVYGVDLDDDGHCLVSMTLTTMGCPLADIITDEIHRALKKVPEVKSSDVKLVWYPAWSPDRMSRY